jgi:hypothetical protein
MSVCPLSHRPGAAAVPIPEGKHVGVDLFRGGHANSSAVRRVAKQWNGIALPQFCLCRSSSADRLLHSTPERMPGFSVSRDFRRVHVFGPNSNPNQPSWHAAQNRKNAKELQNTGGVGRRSLSSTRLMIRF